MTGIAWGPSIVLKGISSCDGDWYFRWLELFNPRIPPDQFPESCRDPDPCKAFSPAARLSRCGIRPGLMIVH